MTNMSCLWGLVPMLSVIFFLADQRWEASRNWSVVNQSQLDAIAGRLRDGRPVRRYAFVALLAVALVVRLGCAGIVREQAATVPATLFIAGLGWTAVSILWAREKRVASRRVGAWIAAWGAGFLLGGVLSLRQACLTIAATASITLAISVCAELRGASWTRRKRFRFAGTLHPNQQAVNCALLLFSLIVLLPSFHWGASIMTPVAVCGLLLTRSRTTVWAMGGACSVVGVAAVANRAGMALWGSVTLLIIAACVGASLHPRVRGVAQRVLLLGRPFPAVMTAGRLPLWKWLVPQLRGRWLIGWGYGGFWNTERFLEARQRAGWRFTDSHSYYLEAIVNVGLVGLGFQLAYFGWALSLSGPLSLESSAFRALVVFVLLQGSTESTFNVPSFFSYSLSLCLSSVAYHGFSLG